ncbi:DUF4248 domain-containing protein [uncultured Bacteroides sp.]|jgi:hypothetical protein|uniref:DUF4248 domain-containing protein n=1 Tax=uncultured Bacteroides sp. TaxID=162156 RepID=UPI002587E45A|nr:DUF4248 domain-containing protein [uncultured Bacteroides sp.]
MKESSFAIRCYDKNELAHLYFPTLTENAAVDKLRRWIRKCRPLMEEIESADFRPKMKMYTGREVRLIVRHLGEPGE